MMIALVILGIVSSGFAYSLQATLGVTQGNRARIQAANLAARELEIVRNQFGSSKSAPLTVSATSQVTNPNPLPGQTAGQPVRVDGRPFTVVRTVQWLPAGTGVSPCDGGSAVTYPSLAVNVNVSWQEKNLTRDVESNTILTPPKGTLATVRGFIAAKIQGADGTGVPSVPVDISGPGGSQTRVTSADGCAVFALDTVGNYTATLDDAGYVSFDGQTSTSKPATVATGTIQIVPFSYDRAARLDLDYVVAGGETGYTLPTPRPSVVLFNPSLPSMGRKEIASGTTSVPNLWPFTNGYSVWPGTCTTNDPAATGGSRPQAVIPDPGQTLSADVTLLPVRATFLYANGQPVVDRLVTATISDTTGCDEASFTFGRTDDQGVARVALPYGQWTLRADSVDVAANVSSATGVTYPLLVPEGTEP
jgi:type II secretory pathway pseudopilin PulG